MAWSADKKAGIHHVCLRVPNLIETRDFYMQGLGASLVVEWGKDGTGDHAFILDLGAGDFLEIFESPEEFGVGKWQHVAVITGDIDASFQKALAAGGKCHQEPRESHIPTRSGELVGMRFAFIRAPGGELVEFIQNI
jgi:catechol 2,3-dioxygenase-like lactoylglutathione lyase family enzyme